MKKPTTTDEEDDLPEEESPLPEKNYMTPQGFAALKEEFHTLLHAERPKVVEIVSWAAGNGDRSENGDYLYGKKRLREIDRRVHYLTKRIESAIVVDSEKQKGLQQVFFGATVTYARENGEEITVTLVGVDEATLTENKISWLSPVAKALMKAKLGTEVTVRTPAGKETLEIISITYS